MLVESSGKLFSSYFEAFLECLIEAEGHIIAVTQRSQGTINMRIELNRDQDNCEQCNSWLDFFMSFVPGVSPTVPHKTMDSMVLAIIYMRGLANWLCIANMLGYNGKIVQQISKEFVAQCVSLSKAVGTVKRYTMPTYFSDTLDIVTNGKQKFTIKISNQLSTFP